METILVILGFLVVITITLLIMKKKKKKENEYSGNDTTVNQEYTTTTSTTEDPSITFWQYNVQTSNEQDAVYSSIEVDLVFSGDNFWQSGMYLWKDSELTDPYTGLNYIKQEGSNTIYNLLGGNNVGLPL